MENQSQQVSKKTIQQRVGSWRGLLIAGGALIVLPILYLRGAMNKGAGLEMLIVEPLLIILIISGIVFFVRGLFIKARIQ